MLTEVQDISGADHEFLLGFYYRMTGNYEKALLKLEPVSYTHLGLDMAINNLVNNLYSKDISKKLKSALKVKWKNGKWTGSKPPFGYLKDEEHGCWKIDPVAGKYVRMIFDKAMEGCNTSQICYYMNEQKVPTPGKYNQMNGLLRQGNRCV